MSTSYTVWPLRMSHQPAATIALFRDLGLRQTVGHEGGSYAVFAGRSGTIGVHDAGRTADGSVSASLGFNLVTADVEAAATELRARGLEVDVWDETYGKQGRAAGPGALEVGLNEDTQQDLYGGYIVDPAEGSQRIAASMDVVVRCATADPERARTFLAEFGFEGNGSDSRLEASPTSGIIALRRSADATTSYGLGFETSEPLDALAARLQSAGHRAEVIEDETGVRVAITDPDDDVIVVRLTS